MKNYKIIQTQNYLLVVDEIAPIEAYKTPAWNEVAGMLIKHSKVDDFFCSVSISKESPLVNGINVFEGIHKIISHLPLNNSPVLEGVDLLAELPTQLDLYLEIDTECALLEDVLHGKEGKRISYIRKLFGDYKAATKTYSEEDLESAFNYGYFFKEDEIKEPNKSSPHTFSDLINSFNKPKLPVGFEAETIGANKIGEDTLTVKTIPNEKGIPVWQGTYLY